VAESVGLAGEGDGLDGADLKGLFETGDDLVVALSRSLLLFFSPHSIAA